MLLHLLVLGAVSGRGGLEAVAPSPDGKLLAVGGQNRVVYLLDAGTLEVKRRLRLGARIGAIAWAGKSLLVEDETDALLRLDAETGKETGRVADASGMLVAGNLVAVRDLKRPDRPAVRLLDAATLAEKARFPLTERASAFAFSADGKRLAVLEGGHESPTEKRIPLRDAPPALKGLARLEFQQKHDGRASWLRVFDVPGTKELRAHRLWYVSDSDGTRLALDGESALVFNRADACARIDGDGKAAMFGTGERSVQALASDGRSLLVGGRAGGSSGALVGKRQPFSLDELPGQAEFVGGWAILPDGSAWGVTTAWRVFRVGKDGTAGKARPVE
ncbi:MAG: hypothetical protein K2W96_24455 [Gemmataceae bacterium]|nr:hypothetical protein [Gemmataceae bacterium]